MRDTLEDLIDLARRAALAGGEVVRAGVVEASAIETKGAGDYVTAVDRASERAIGELLAAATPDIPMIGEERGGARSERYWVVDPLDGTTNFVHRFPVVGVSVALIEAGQPVVGCVHAPFLAQTWTGGRGLGGRADDGSALRISTRAPEAAVVGTGFPFRRKRLIPRHLAALEAALTRFEDLRRPGAAALDLAWVAAGVFDGFFELGLSAWDVAAGGLLIREAGGVVTDWEGGDRWLGGDILAAPPAVHEILLDIARSAPRGD